MTKLICNLIIAGTVIIVLSLTAFGVYSMVQKKKYTKTVYSSSSALEKLLDINELHMMTIPFNGVAEKTEQEKNGKTKLLYNVKYKGLVILGTDEKIGMKIDDETKTITLTIPMPHVLDVIVDFKSMDYIFIKKKYETETISQETYRLCQEDIRKELEKDDNIFQKARSNTENVVRGLFKSFENEYKVEIN